MREMEHTAGHHPLVRTAVGNIDKARKRAGMSLTDLADRLGRAPSGLSFIMRGERGASVTFIADCAEVFRVPAWQLFQPGGPCLSCKGTPEDGRMCLYCGTSGTMHPIYATGATMSDQTATAPARLTAIQ